MSEIMKIIESIRKIDEEIKRLQVERHKYIAELQEKIHELLEETEQEMSMKCLEEIITKAPSYKEIICAIKSEYGIEKIEEYYKDSKTVKFVNAYKVLLPDLLSEEVLKFITEEFNKKLIIVEDS